ncbi:MAG: gliding motility-associated C-terminal domain-containing protein, partial [Bacteroidota bacterium]
NGCSAMDATEIIVRFPQNIYVPNVFSPDFDGINDVFYPFAGNDVAQILTFRVFDRWGELLHENLNFQPNDPTYGWDGTFRGQPMNPGIFVYYLEVEFINGQTEVIKGDVLLMQ